MKKLHDRQDDRFFFAGIIVISAAGVAVMGLEKVHFFWYVREISGLALIGYFAGAVIYIVQYGLLHG